MALIENILKGAVVGVLGLMTLTVVGGGVMAGAMGLLNDPVVMAFSLGGFLLFLVLFVAPLAVGGLWLYRWWRLSAIRERQQSEFVAPDESGRLPVPASLLRQPSGAQLAFAQNVASFTNNLTHYHYAPESTQNITGADGQTMSAAATAAPGSFWQLYQAGQLPENGFLMGYSLDEDGETITADWRKLYSALIGGQSGSGKSTLIRGILAQSALQGGRFVVIDPHYNSGDESLGASLQPLRSLMLCDVASDERQIVDALNYVAAIGQRRLNGQDTDKTPVVLVVDETTALLQRSKVAGALESVLGQIAQETRKAGLYALCIGQNFHSDVMPTTIRDCFVSYISCRARKRVAATMADDNEFGKMAAELTVGQAVWMTPAGDVHRLAVPNCTQHDLELVAGAVIDAKKTAGGKNGGLLWETTTSKALPRHFQGTSNDAENDVLEVAGSGSGSALEVGREVDQLRSQRVITAFLDGDSYTKIAKDIYGVTGGRKYNDARDEIDLILRSHMLTLKKGN